MNEYREKYEILKTNVRNIENIINKLEKDYEFYDGKLKKENIKLLDIELRMYNITNQIKIEINKNCNIIHNIKNIFNIGITILTGYLMFNIYKNIAPIGIIKNIFTITSIMSGYLSIIVVSFLTTTSISKYLINKIIKRNCKKNKCLELTNEFESINREYEEKNKEKIELENKIEEINKAIREKEVNLSINIDELKKLEENIINLVINFEEENIDSNTHEVQNKYKLVKKLNN